MTEKKRRITKLRLHEVSAVDKPAQVGATVVLIKRDDDLRVEKGMFLDALSEVRGLTSERVSGAREITERLSDAHWAMDKALRATITFDLIADKKAAIIVIASEYFTKVRELLDQLSDLLITKRSNKMSDKDLKSAISKAVSDAVTGVLGEENKDNSNSDDITKAVIKAIEPSIDASNEALKIATLPQASRDYLDDLKKSTEIKDDEKTTLREQFLSDKATDEKRAEVVKAWSDSAEVYKTMDGRILKRSELGAAYDPLITEIKKNDEQSAELAALKQAKVDRAMVEKSRTEMPSLSGDDDTRLALEKVISALPENQAENVRLLLKSGNNAIESTLKPIGDEGGDADDPDEKLNAMARGLVEKSDSSLSFGDAYMRVLETKEGSKLYEQHTAKVGSTVS